MTTRTVSRRVEYTLGGLRNEDGTRYTGDNDYVLAAARNLTYLRQDPVLFGAIADMVGTRENFNIMKDPNDANNNEADPFHTQTRGKGTTIYWSGQESSYYDNMIEANRSQPEPAFATLAHELIGHAWMRFKGLERQGDELIDDPRFTGYRNRHYGSVPRREIDAVNIENRAIMIENRCIDLSCSSLRTKYAGRDISPYLDFEGFMEPKSRNPKPPTLKRSRQ